eukprot:TRINITY_DN12146_c0_g5_i1.p1 TRINITY_DN12146_c0_g5~~TRINITY_DN12146_c0_g5_i1.p1  ORF type:complete len:274 (+),score=24.95 TRINITY_DN12146_c0_g5_i1:140-961(+)
MAEDKLNKSLDQLIEENRIERPISTRGNRRIIPDGQFRGGRGRSTLRGRGRGRGYDYGRFGNRKQLTVVVQNTRGGGVRKPINRSGRIVSSFRSGRQGVEGTLQSRRRLTNQQHSALEGDGKWQHDLFQDDGPRLTRGTKTYQQTNSQSGQIVVNNLNFNVSNEDIQELFARIGPLRKFGVKFDRSGRSEGVAEVEFVNYGDAERAMKQYDGVMLDGQRMSIKIISKTNQINTSNGNQKGLHIATLKSGIQVSRGVQRSSIFKQSDVMDMDMD